MTRWDVVVSRLSENGGELEYQRLLSLLGEGYDVGLGPWITLTLFIEFMVPETKSGDMC